MAKYIEYKKGSGLPLIICVPHDGWEYPADIKNRTEGGLISDSKTLEIGKGLFDGLTKKFGMSPHLVISKLHRSKMDPNRPINEATEGDLKAEAAYKAYHKF